MSIADLRAAGEAATPGPWRSHLSGDAMYLDAGRIGLMAGIHAKERPDDAAFCALARNSWDALIAVVEEARACLPFIADTDGTDPGLALEQALAHLAELARA